MKLTLKFVLALSLGIVLVFSVEGILRVQRQLQLFESDMKRDHLSMGRTLSAAVAELLADEKEVDVLALVDKVNRRHVSTEIRWVETEGDGDGLGCPLSTETCDKLRAGEEVQEIVKDDSIGGRYLRTYVPVVPRSVPEGALELSESFHHQRQFVRVTIARTVVTTSITVLMCCAIALGLGTFFVGQPVRQLVTKARRVGAGDFSWPLQLRQRDEIGELAVEMNRMSEQLASAHASIEAEASARVRAVEQLRHADRLTTVGKMAAGIAHELGTPLNVVSGRASMISSGEVKGDDVKTSARIIVEQAEKITTIIRQLLNFARRGETNRSGVDLRRLAVQTISLLSPMARKKNVTLVLEGDEAETVQEVDGGQIQQVLMNVILNGIHAMPGGGIVTVRTCRDRLTPPPGRDGGEQECYVYSVTDQGVGISEADRARIFDPFFTTKPVGEGTGLGLSVAYGIVVDHGGWIDVQSAPQDGSTFRIVLPTKEIE